jgi:ion channel-forming bestrophin family protein
MVFAIKNHLRAEWGSSFEANSSQNGQGNASNNTEFMGLLPLGFSGHEDDGLGLTLELACIVELYIKKGHDRGWFHAPQSSQMQVQLNTLVDAYGKMETIRLTPLPVAHL